MAADAVRMQRLARAWSARRAHPRGCATVCAMTDAVVGMTGAQGVMASAARAVKRAADAMLRAPESVGKARMDALAQDVALWRVAVQRRFLVAPCVRHGDRQ